MGGGASDFVERGIRRAPGLLGWLTGLSGNISNSIERSIDRVPDMLERMTEGVVSLSAWVEKATFTGVHVSMPQASGALGRAMTKTEEIIGRPVVIGGIIIVSLSAILIRALWF